VQLTVSVDESGQIRTRAIVSLKALLDGREWAKAESEAAGLLALYPDDTTILAAYARCAVEAGDHATALARWTSCRDRFPDQPRIWRLGVANALLKLGRYNEAEREFRQGLEEKDSIVAGLTGLATTLGYTDPAQAEGWWLKAFEAAPRPMPIWLVIRAQSVADAGDGERAYQLLSEVFDATPDPPEAAYRLLVRLLIETGRRAEAAHEINSGRLRVGAKVRSAHRLRLQVWLNDRDGARGELRQLSASARTPAELTVAFEAASRALNSYERRRTHLEIRDRLASFAAADAPDAIALALRLDLALRDYDRYRGRLRAAARLPDRWDRPLRKIGEKLSAAKFPDYDAPKIFGIGLSRTGTSSLGSALERLGFLHAHFANPLTLELLRDDDFALLDSANITGDPPALPGWQ
jgi:tetratricopeptide (TPR) repeat protein